ncbi:MAG: hypothetical protein JWN04_1493 [Myxococcaceae bacterium]|nr:hypothetical protein [Myxococcaceae bacterium]
MYGNSSKSHAAAQRSLERRKSEDDAPRLATEIPSLRSAKIQVTELVPTGSTKHVKHVIVARAPALFIIPCGDATCQDGGHDITPYLMSAFRRRQTTFEGESGCGGTSGSAQCSRSIRYQLIAEYAADAPR